MSDTLTGHLSGGQPEMAKRTLGHLGMRSDTLAFGDPQSVGDQSTVEFLMGREWH